MKSAKAAGSYATPKNARIWIRALLLGFFALDRQAGRAQDILAPTPRTPDQTPTAMQHASEMDVFAPPPPETEAQPLKWGGFVLRPHPYYQFMYADGLLAGVNQLENSTVQQISPGVLLELGSHWTLDYSPQWSIYSNNHFSDDFGQAVTLTGGATYNDWVLGLSQYYANVSSLSAETATQTRVETFTTDLNGSYTMNSKLSLDLAVNQNFVSADQLSSYKEWSTMDWLNCQFEPRLNAALGAGGGYDDVDASPDMTFERVQGRVGWRATDKISFQLHGGVEVRQFLSGGASTLINPIFDATIQYQPFEHTQVSLTGSRVVSSSITQNELTETTMVNASLNQRLLGKFFLNLTGSYQDIKYVSSLGTPGSNRQDDLYTLNARLSRAFLKRGTVGVFYQISRDDSNQPGYSFISHQVGFQVGFTY